MTTIYNIDSVTQGQNAFGLPFNDTIFSAKLKAATDTTLAVPLSNGLGMPASYVNNKWIAVIVCDDSSQTYVAVNATAAVPAGAGFAATTSELVPYEQMYGKYCKSGDTLHFISPGTPNITVAFYAILD